MAHALKIQNLGSYLHVIVEGDTTAKDIADYLAEVREKCIEFHCPNVLIEENLAGPSIGFFAVYGIVTKVCLEAASVIRHVAYVDINPEHKKEINKFAETMAVNRGMNIRLFETIREAENWLGKTISSSAKAGLIPKDQPDRRKRA